MGLFTKLFKREESDDIPYDAFKRDVSADTSSSGCESCRNKKEGLCKGKNFSCEAYRPIDGENSAND